MFRDKKRIVEYESIFIIFTIQKTKTGVGKFADQYRNKHDEAADEQR